MTLSKLIAKLEAAKRGGRNLDNLIGETLSLDTRYEHPGSEEPSHLCYTTSLDAALPWERIVQMVRDVRTGLWLAWHEKHDNSPDRREGTARTEPLARRIAALKAKEADHGS